MFVTSQGDDYTTGCLIYYNYFKNYDKMTVIYLSKQKALDANLKVIQQDNFTGNLDGNNNRLLFFINDDVKETILDFSQGTAKVLWLSYCILHNFILF